VKTEVKKIISSFWKGQKSNIKINLKTFLNGFLLQKMNATFQHMRQEPLYNQLHYSTEKQISFQNFWILGQDHKEINALQKYI